MKNKFPGQTEKYSKTIGLFSYEKEGEGVSEKNRNQSTIVLVHGLDDPGKVWQNLAPALVKEDFDVWHLEYPNDQPVVESAFLFFEELKNLRSRGVNRITIVAHSMGGLVSRELLTSDTLGYRSSLQQKRVPLVDRLIMIGTPNHGSQMARFRIFSEIRDHLDRLFKGQANGLGFVLDGAGEAKIDLLPGSSFLTELNARPHPAEVDMMIIAGITAPWEESDITNWLNNIGEKVGSERSDELKQVGRFMQSMSNGLGDGLVTLESASLEDVPLITVNGTHLSMIRNISLDSMRIPPAVPLIIERLNEGR
ncbi:MAG: alpha/beta fold hydrolase [Desulforhopalus sp.]